MPPKLSYSHIFIKLVHIEKLTIIFLQDILKTLLKSFPTNENSTLCFVFELPNVIVVKLKVPF